MFGLIMTTLAAYVVYRHWSSDSSLIHWFVLAALFFWWWIRQAVMSAMHRSVQNYSEETGFEYSVAKEASPWLQDATVRRWTQISMVATLIAIGSTIYGLVTLL